jgi:phosphatidylglycerophosphatase A
LIAVFFISKAEKKLGHDSNKIVLDEFMGYFIAVVFLPKTVLIAIFAFILFRFFDIFKPEPVNVLQKLPAGWGVMADDLMAGVYTNISLQMLTRFFPGIIK